jgi:hypothetical protein
LVKVSFPLGTKVVVTFKGEPLRIELDCTTSASHDFGKFPRSPVLYIAFNADKHPAIAALKTVLGPKLIKALQVPNSPAHTALVEAIKGTKAFAGLEPAAVAASIAEAVDGLSVDARFRDDTIPGACAALNGDCALVVGRELFCGKRCNVGASAGASATRGSSVRSSSASRGSGCVAERVLRVYNDAGPLAAAPTGASPRAKARSCQTHPQRRPRSYFTI